MATVTKCVQTHCSWNSTKSPKVSPFIKPHILKGSNPKNGSNKNHTSQYPAGRYVGQNRKIPQPRRGQHHERGEDDEHLLPPDILSKNGNFRVRKEFVQIVTFQDEELDREQEELEVHEDGD